MQINQNKWKQRLITLSFVVSVLLTGFKFVAYFHTGSNAILSDALESIINVIASGFALYSIRLSAQPKDYNHPYGHGKIEFFSAGFEGAMIVIASLFIIYTGFVRLAHPVVLENLSEGSLLILITAIINGALGYLLMKEGKKLRSLALIADGRHILSDSVSSFLLLLGVVLILVTGMNWIDPVISIVFGVILTVNGWKLVRKSISGLMDETDPHTFEEIVAIMKAKRKDYWVDVHNVRLQRYGGDLHMDCHLTLPFYWSLLRAHEAVREFEDEIRAESPGEIEIFVHSDPCIPNCCNFCKLQHCPERSHPFVQDIDWDTLNLAKNQKLFHTGNQS